MSDKIENIGDAWIKLYDDKSFQDRSLTLKYTDHPNGYSDLGALKSDNGKSGFNDKASSVRWKIPRGWKAVLYDDKEFKDSRFELRGNGDVQEIADMGSYSDKASSFNWEETSD